MAANHLRARGNHLPSLRVLWIKLAIITAAGALGPWLTLP